MEKELQSTFHHGNLKAVKIITLIALISLPLTLSATDNSTNILWIEGNLVSIFDSVEIKNVLNSNHYKVELGAVQGEKAGFIKKNIIHYLQSNKQKVESKNIYKVWIEQFDVSIVYQQFSSGFLGFSSDENRENRVIITGWIEDENSTILHSFNVTKIFKEKLITEDKQYLESSPYIFSRGETRELSIWSEIVEPTIVAGSIAGLVYLFFSVRS